MRLEEALKTLRHGGTISLKGHEFTEAGAFVSRTDLLGDDWEVSLSAEQIIEHWEAEACMREATGQKAQAVLLRECITLLRTRKLR